jgi:hypothetical protein
MSTGGPFHQRINVAVPGIVDLSDMPIKIPKIVGSFSSAYSITVDATHHDTSLLRRGDGGKNNRYKSSAEIERLASGGQE